jgi:ureidoacrylate peracid hydrolase
MNRSPHRLAPDEAFLRRDEGLAETPGPTRAALLVIDLQNDFCHTDGVFARAKGMRVDDLSGLLARVGRLVRAARAAHVGVIWTRMVWDSDDEVGLLGRGGFLAKEGLRRGTWGAELLSGLDVRRDDAVVDKKRFSAFFATDLERLLLDRGIGRLYVAGVRTDYCVESTVRDAFFRDLDAIVVRDCVAGYFDALHESSLTEMATIFAEVIDCEAAVERLGGEATAARGAPTAAGSRS